MQLAKLVTAINYQEVPRGIDYRSRLLELVTDGGKIKPPQTTLSEILQVKVEKKKMFFIVSGNKTGVEINQPKNKEEAVKESISFFKRTNNLVNWENLSRIGTRSMWIQEWDSDFNQLVKTYKEKIYRQNSLLDKSTDVAVYFTFSERPRLINFASGPMKKEEIIQKFMPPAPFQKSLLPKVFAFVDHDYYLPGKTRYSNSTLEKFISHATEMGEIRARELFKILKD